MRKLILLIIIVSTFCAATFTYAGEVIKVTNFKIIKVQSGPSFVQFTLIAKEWDDWVEYPIKSKADANKALNYFSKLDLDKKAVIFIRDGVVIGATSSKFGNFGTPPSNKASSTSGSKTYIVTFDKGFSPQQKAAVLEIANAIRSGEVKAISKYTKNKEDAKNVKMFWSGADELSNLKFRARINKKGLTIYDAGTMMYSCDVKKDGNNVIIIFENEGCIFNDGN